MTPQNQPSTPSADQVLQAFDRIRRAQNEGQWAPHKPLLILLALARVQRGEARMVAFGEVEDALKALLTEFGPSSAPRTRHLPFWHLHSDAGGGVWQLDGPPALLARPRGTAPCITEMRTSHLAGGFAPPLDRALRQSPALLQSVARRVLEAYFPATLHEDIASAVGLDLDSTVGGGPLVVRDAEAPGYLVDAAAAQQPAGSVATRRPCNAGFRERVLRAYEYRCCVCGFDLCIGTVSAGLEAAHIQWHQAGGPDIEPNGLALCALHHKLFDLGAFTVEPGELRVVFSQHAIAGHRGAMGELRFHGKPIGTPQEASMSPGLHFVDWNWRNVFKRPQRILVPRSG